MPRRKQQVQLSEEERSYLKRLTSKGQVQVRVYQRARVLLLSDGEPGLSTAEVARRVGVSVSTVKRLRSRYLSQKAERAVAEKPRPGRPRRFSGEQRAQITALACSTPPEGYSQWSLRLLADKVVELGWVESISYGSVRSVLKKTNFSPT